MPGVVERVIIIGGGIGGLCTAIGLRRIGVDAIVYEQAEVLSQVGAGLTLWANAIKALRKLGLADAVIRAGSKIEHGAIRTAGGRTLSRSEPGEIERLCGEPTIAIHRADLHDILLSALPADTARLGAKCTGFEQEAEGVTVRFAGFTFLFYIAVAFPSMVLFGRATSGEGIAARFASIAQHAIDIRVAVVLSLLGCFSALVLAVTLYAITREVDADLAMLALTCRVAEGVISGISIPETLGLLWLATATGANAPDPGAAHTLGAYLLKADMAVTATFFAVGSTLFSYLFLRGRMIPRRAGLARRAGVGSAGRGASAADRRRPSGLDHSTHVFTYARVRNSARTMATHQRSRHARDAMSDSQLSRHRCELARPA